MATTTKFIFAVALAFVPAKAWADGGTPDQAGEESSANAGNEGATDRAPDDGDDDEVVLVVGSPPGAAQVISKKQLETFEHDDAHKVLRSVPGVYVREEDGYGLRPNIGMRGSGSERSAKIVIMEDGILSSPAPYSAPAAYYFPVMTRMSAVEVVKGPAAIRYGPHTVGGSLNMVSRGIPAHSEATVDIAGGNTLYGKAHVSYGRSWKYFGFVAEALKLRSDGFKELDGGGNTGFDKNDALMKVRANTDESADVYHEFFAKVGYSDEVSNETYTGLSVVDFETTPYRRYLGTQLDRMAWDHLQLSARHTVQLSDAGRISTTAYRNTFQRDWRKLNSFVGSDIDSILENPNSGANAVFYAVLTGAEDTSGSSDTLVIGTNSRTFVSQGGQSKASLHGRWLGVAHQLEAGLRIHMDEVERFHFEDRYAMMSSQLVRDETPRDITRNAVATSVASAAYVQDRVKLGRFELTAGLRGEWIETDYQSRLDDSVDNTGRQLVLIPGGGITFDAGTNVQLLAGVHRGFSPAAPGPDMTVEPELSVNYEAGVRAWTANMTAEAVGFFSNYSNLRGTCTFSSGCDDVMIDNEFNAGRVHVYGVEASLNGEWSLSKQLRLPVRVAYTLNQAQFRTSFLSGNPLWGEVDVGDELPYLPTHQVTGQAGVAGDSWHITASGTFTGAMRDIAGQGADGFRTDASWVIDLAASYRFGSWGTAYATVNNIFDQAFIVSRRPIGVRPGVPRLVVLGYRNSF